MPSPSVSVRLALPTVVRVTAPAAGASTTGTWAPSMAPLGVAPSEPAEPSSVTVADCARCTASARRWATGAEM
jgi:hypothetical protein